MSIRSRGQNPDQLEKISFLQDFVVSREQLRATGFDADAVRYRVSIGRWQALGLAVVVHSATIGVRERRWAAILSATGAVALAGPTASERCGLWGFESYLVHALVPAGSRPVAIAGVRWHPSRRFSARDVLDRDGLACVSVARAVVDTASWTPSPRIACATVAAAVQPRLTTAVHLRVELEISGCATHRRLLISILADIAGGAIRR